MRHVELVRALGPSNIMLFRSSCLAPMWERRLQPLLAISHPSVKLPDQRVVADFINVQSVDGGHGI